MAEANIFDNMNALFDNLGNLLTSKTVIGEPITFGHTTIIPVVEVSFGLAVGGGSGEDRKKRGGAASGVGGKLSATAVIVIRGDHVQVMQLNRANTVDKLVDLLPEMVDKFKPSAHGDQEEI